jgi:hypothetical protein
MNAQDTGNRQFCNPYNLYSRHKHKKKDNSDSLHCFNFGLFSDKHVANLGENKFNTCNNLRSSSHAILLSSANWFKFCSWRRFTPCPTRTAKCLIKIENIPFLIPPIIITITKQCCTKPKGREFTISDN